MYISAGIAAIVVGVFCIPGIYSKINPDISDIHKKIAYIQGSFGFIVCLWGIILIINAIISGLNWLSEGWIFYWITFFITGTFIMCTGFLLGFGMIQQITISRIPGDLKIRAQEFHRKLVNIYLPLGFISIALGVWVIVFHKFTARF